MIKIMKKKRWKKIMMKNLIKMIKKMKLIIKLIKNMKIKDVPIYRIIYNQQPIKSY